MVWDFNFAGTVLQVGISSESALAEALPPCLLCAMVGCSACLIHVHPQVYRAWCVIMLGSMVPCTCCTCLKQPGRSQFPSPNLRGDPISPSLKSPPTLAFERPPFGPFSLLGGSYSPGLEDTVGVHVQIFLVEGTNGVDRPVCAVENRHTRRPRALHTTACARRWKPAQLEAKGRDGRKQDGRRLGIRVQQRRGG